MTKNATNSNYYQVITLTLHITEIVAPSQAQDQTNPKVSVS